MSRFVARIVPTSDTLVRHQLTTQSLSLNDQPSNTGSEVTFTFDSVLAPADQTGQLVDVVKPIMEHVCEGGNGVIFAFGETGTGKTTTMFGEGKEGGLVEMCCQKILEKKKLKVSVFEIYLEKVFDLGRHYMDAKLAARPVSARVRESKLQEIPEQDENFEINDNGVVCMVNEIEQVKSIIKLAFEKRTNFPNAKSTMCVMVSVEISGKLSTTVGTLCLVDLAGSEQKNEPNIRSFVNRYMETRVGIPETGSTVRDVILNTFLEPLKKPMCVVIAHVNLSALHLTETISTLNFVSRLKTPSIASDDGKIAKLQAEISSLRAALLQSSVQNPSAVPALTAAISNDGAASSIASARPMSANNPPPLARSGSISRNSVSLTPQMASLASFLNKHQLDPAQAILILTKQVGPQAVADIDDNSSTLIVSQLEPKQKKYVEGILRREAALKAKLEQTETESKAALAAANLKANKTAHEVALLKGSIRVLTQELKELHDTSNKNLIEQAAASQAQVKNLMHGDSQLLDQQNQKINHLKHQIGILQQSQAAFNVQEEEWHQKLVQERKNWTKSKEEELSNLKDQYEYWLEMKSRDITQFMDQFESYKKDKTNQLNSCLEEISILYEYLGVVTTILQNTEAGMYPISEKSGIKAFKLPADLKATLTLQINDPKRGKFVQKSINFAKQWFSNFVKRSSENLLTANSQPLLLQQSLSKSRINTSGSASRLQTSGSNTSLTGIMNYLDESVNVDAVNNSRKFQHVGRSSTAPAMNMNMELGEYEFDTEEVASYVGTMSLEDTRNELIGLKLAQKQLEIDQQSVKKAASEVEALQQQALADLSKNETVKYIKKLEEEKNHFKSLLASETKRLDDLKIAYQAQSRLMQKTAPINLGLSTKRATSAYGTRQ